MSLALVSGDQADLTTPVLAQTPISIRELLHDASREVETMVIIARKGWLETRSRR